tara:strand:- start:33309 stop:35036 length:1728 start_codon:yes stop_codon:yes gene_type:complete
MRFLQAFASQLDGGQPSLTISTLKILKGEYSKTEKVYTIPKDSAELETSADVYFNDPDPILNTTKDEYNANIVFYFLNIDKSKIDYEKVNLYFRKELANLTSQENTSVIDVILSQNANALENEIDAIVAEQQKDLEKYESAAPEGFLDSLDEQLSGGEHGATDENEDEIEDEIEIDSYESIASGVSIAGNLEANLGLVGNQPSQIGYNESQINSGPASINQGASPGDMPAINKPKSLNKVPAFDLSGLSAEDQRIYETAEELKLGYLNGIGGGRLIEPVPPLDAKPGDAVLQSKNNSGIIATRDEFYKLRGHTKSGAVYMFAGRSPDNIIMEQLPEGQAGPPAPVVKPNDLIGDAAYVYLSQKSDVDNLLRVAGGTYSKVISKIKEFSPTETRQGISVAAVKADDVVLMSRTSGIRLITGTDKTNSRGGEQYSKFGIDLIAGNEDQDLQPLVKGDNLTTYLEGLSKSVGEVSAILLDFLQSQFKFNAALAQHTHYDPFAILIGFMSTNGTNPLALGGGKNYTSPEVVNAGRDAMLNNMIQTTGCKAAGQNRINNDTAAFSKLGSYKILSEKNRTN